MALAWGLLAAACPRAQEASGAGSERSGPGALAIAVSACTILSPPAAEGLHPLALGFHRASRLLDRGWARGAGWLRGLAGKAREGSADAGASLQEAAARASARLPRLPGTRQAAVRHQRPAPAGAVRPQLTAAEPTARRAAAHRIKTAEELRVERIVEAAVQEYYRQYRIAGLTFTLRMPFGLNNEREDQRGFSQVFQLGGKGAPGELWPHIDAVLGSAAFRRYAEDLLAAGDKVVVFDLRRRSYQMSQDPALLQGLETGPYPGSPTRVYVKREGQQLLESDLYNYLYAVAAVGVDCSGFTHHLHRSIAAAYGLDLDGALAAKWRVRPRLVASRVGLWFYDPNSGYTEAVEDRVENLRPGDVLLFRGRDGSFKHSAVIQSVDLEHGLLRYAQSTDWAPEEERGVHLSVARFDPSRPGVSLGHYTVRWLQQVRPPFRGELEPADWLNDGDRYRWYPQAGGSQVVRLRHLAAALLERAPEFYTTLYGELYGEAATASSSWAAPSAPPPPSAQR